VPYKNIRTTIKIGLIFSLLFFSCEKKNEKAVILLSPFEMYIPAQTSEVVVIEVNCHSPIELKQLIIKSRLEGGYSVTELDSIISGKELYLRYEYLVPVLSENSTISLEFTIIDVSGERVSNFRMIQATGAALYLKETAGHEMFSGFSAKQNGYNLVTGTPNFLHLSDSSDVHIADTTNTETLLKRWVSPAGIKLVRFNGFDYANCTNTTAKSAYDAGIKNDYIENVAEGDIYITRIRSRDLKEIYPVIKIMNVTDNPGAESDKYVFNIKK